AARTSGDDGEHGLGEGPLPRHAATHRVTDHVAGLAAERLLARLGTGRNLERDTPSDLILVEFHEIQVGEGRLLLVLRLSWSDPLPIQFEARRVKEVEGRADWSRTLRLLFSVLVDMRSGLELRHDLEGHGITHPGLRGLNRRGQGGGLGFQPGTGV